MVAPLNLQCWMIFFTSTVNTSICDTMATTCAFIFTVKMLTSYCGLKEVFCCVVLQCDVCQKTFVRPCLLRSHVRLAHPSDSTVEVYKCTQSGCNRTYASVRSLRQHVRAFHEGQVAECQQCPRSLSTKVQHILS